MQSRLNQYCVTALIFMLFVSPTWADDARWQQLKEVYFGDRAITVSDDIIEMEAPSRAHDAATVPIRITTNNPHKAVR